MVTLIFNTGMFIFTVFTIGLQFIFKKVVVVVIVEVYCIEVHKGKYEATKKPWHLLTRRIPLKLDVRSLCPLCNMFELHVPDL